MNSRTFSIAITACGECLEELDLFVGERPDFQPPHEDHADGRAFAQKRHGELGTMPCYMGASVAMLVARVRFGKIGEMDGTSIEDCTAGDACACEDAGRQGGNRTEVRYCAMRVVFDESDDDIVCAAKPRGPLGHRIEHRLGVGGRAADDAQNLSGRGLLLSAWASSRVHSSSLRSSSACEVLRRVVIRHYQPSRLICEWTYLGVFARNTLVEPDAGVLRDFAPALDLRRDVLRERFGRAGPRLRGCARRAGA